MLPLTLVEAVLGARAKKVAEPPPPEPSMLPLVLSIVACWVVPFLLMQIMQGAPKAKVGINGFGRIGRLVARAMCKAAGVELVAIVSKTTKVARSTGRPGRLVPVLSLLTV
jgi:hypothetical protein